jgi:3-(3-hydroxy-phenyl)propionate hydroxylase
LEFFDRIGLYEKLEPRGIIAPKFHYWDRQSQTLIAEFDHALLKDDTRFPFVLQCERIKIIEEALKLAKAHPLIDVRMATEFSGFEQQGDAVLAFAQDSEGRTQTVRGSYLVSAEGARSIARKDLGIEFEGFTYPERTINIEVAYDFPRHGYAERNYISDPVEYSNLFHWKGPPDRWRIHFPTEIDEPEDKLKRPEALQARLQRFLGIEHEFEICGCNLYTVHQRVAASMGLNSGVHDAFNLADKLAAVLRGEADDGLLDRYERQRRHVAIKHTQAQTIRNKRLLEERDPTVRARNHDELRRQAEDPALARKFLMRTALFDSLREAEQIL